MILTDTADAQQVIVKLVANCTTICIAPGVTGPVNTPATELQAKAMVVSFAVQMVLAAYRTNPKQTYIDMSARIASDERWAGFDLAAVKTVADRVYGAG